MLGRLIVLALATALSLPAVSVSVGGSARAADANSVEVLHFWTSGGEAAALNILRKKLESEGIGWHDMPVAGGGGEAAMTVLRARVTAGDPPTAVQMQGFEITDWAVQGKLADLTELAKKEGYDKVIPPAVQKFSTYQGKWVAVPVGIHSSSWVWASKKLFDQLHLAPPTDWNGLVAALDAIKKAGYVALAVGGQPWQESDIFDNLVLSTGGPDFYRKALVELDPAALGGAQMKTVFERLKILASYADANNAGRDWNLATAMVITDKAGMQIMGDWAKGEFKNAKKKAGEDFLCFRFPGTAGDVIFNSDQFVMFNVGAQYRPAQLKLAAAVEDPVFQAGFNQVKGSVPARTDISDAGFDPCGQQGIKDIKAASAANTLLGSMTHGHAAPTAVKQAMYDVITAAFTGQYDPSRATAELVKAVAAAK